MIIKISSKKLLFSAAMVALAAAAVIGGTYAYFSDAEKSTGDVFAAGTVDLKVDNVQHYNEMTCAELPTGGYAWAPAGQWDYDADFHPTVNGSYDPDAWNEANPYRYPKAGDECTGTWKLNDLSGTGSTTVAGLKFFNFTDIKPQDSGENTVSLHVFNNDAWACAEISNVVQAENGILDPEARLNDDDTAGELGRFLEFFFWRDDGDNVYEPQAGEQALTAEPVKGDDIADKVFAIADSNSSAGPILGSKEGSGGYLGAAWCFGEMTVSPDGQIACAVPEDYNLSQSDTLSADVKLSVVQVRNNEDFVCGPGEDEEPPVITVTQGTNASPVEETTSGIGAEWFAKFKNLNNNYERVIGTNATEQNWGTLHFGDAVWQSGVPQEFELSYDGAGTAYLKAQGYEDISYPVGTKTYSRLAIALKAPENVTTEVHDLVFDKGLLSITSLTATERTRWLLIEGVDLSAGFSLKGKFSITPLPAGAMQDNPRVGFFVD